MHDLKPKEQHERLLANADIEKIVRHLENGEDQEVTWIAVTLARQCDLFVHFKRLWMLRVSDLEKLGKNKNVSGQLSKLAKELYVRKRK